MYTAKELIEDLQNMPPDYIVVMGEDNPDIASNIGRVEVAHNCVLLIPDDNH
jgi:hypothetical protein